MSINIEGKFQWWGKLELGVQLTNSLLIQHFPGIYFSEKEEILKFWGILAPASYAYVGRD